jgi:hypothetical protein
MDLVGRQHVGGECIDQQPQCKRLPKPPVVMTDRLRLAG